MEIWKDIEGYEGYYQVSSYGNVRSLDRFITNSLGRKVHYRGKDLKKNYIKDSYIFISLHVRGKIKTCAVHRLVAKAFIENKYNLPEVNHMDEDKHNSHVDNLEWCTGKYNSNYGTGMARRSASPGIKLIIEKQSRKIIQKDLKGNTIRTWDSIRAASRESGETRNTIRNCIRIGVSRRGKYLWDYTTG